MLTGNLSRPTALTQAEDALDNTQFRRRRVQARHRHPVIHHHTGADNWTTTVDTARHQRHLQQRTELVLVLHARLRMDQATRIAQAHVATSQHIIRNRLAEDLDAEHVGDDLLGLALQVRVDEGDRVVCADDVAQRRQPLLDALDLDRVRDAVAQVLQLLVRRRRRHQKPPSVARRQSPHDACPRDRRVADGDYVGQLGFEDAVRWGKVRCPCCCRAC